MTEDKTPKEIAPEVAERQLAVDEHEKLFELVRQHGGRAMAAVVVAVAVIIGMTYLQMSRQAEKTRASQALAEAAEIQDFQAVADEFGETAAGSLAQLGVGAEHFRSGQFAEAYQAYEVFVAAYPDHPMREGAEFCMIQCREAEGKVDEALAAYDALGADLEDGHYLAGLVVMGKSRCLIEQGNLEKARTVLEDFIAADPENTWVPQAETSLLLMERDLRAGPQS